MFLMLLGFLMFPVNSDIVTECQVGIAADPAVPGLLKCMDISAEMIGKNAYSSKIWLVVIGTMEFYDFPYIGNLIIPTDFHIFRGVDTTNQRYIVIEATKMEMLGHESISWFGIYNWLVASNMAFIFHFIYGMSSFPLTNSIIFQDGHIAPPTR